MLFLPNLYFNCAHLHLFLSFCFFLLQNVRMEDLNTGKWFCERLWDELHKSPLLSMKMITLIMINSLSDCEFSVSYRHLGFQLPQKYLYFFLYFLFSSSQWNNVNKNDDGHFLLQPCLFVINCFFFFRICALISFTLKRNSQLIRLSK